MSAINDPPSIDIDFYGMSNDKSKDRFVCEVWGCKKSFARLDHLTRHQLNHESIPQHKCTWPGCNKTFVRKDVYQKHYRKQHEGNPSQDKNKMIKFVMMEGDNFKAIDTKKGYTEEEEVLSHEKSMAKENLQDKFQLPGRHVTIADRPEHQTFLTVQTPITPGAGFSIDDLVSTNEMIKWLFGNGDTSEGNSQNGISPNLEEFEHPYPDRINIKNLTNDLDQPTGFPFSSEQTVVDEKVMEGLLLVVPTLKGFPEFQHRFLTEFLQDYWQYFHPQFPVLNMPSFSTKNSHPILLLAMISIGVYISNALSKDHNGKVMNFAHHIAEPLRLALYQAKEFKPPPAPWVVQALVILESFETCCSTRDLHERANLHRGISIQMLKRSPLLGGNPWIKFTYSKEDSDANIYANSTREEWEKWIERESLKRCTFAIFYLQTLNAVVFGHDTIIGLHEFKPGLPCDEEMWNSGRYKAGAQNNMTLLAAIKYILRKKQPKISGFGQKIILTGLISLAYEIREREFEFSIPGIENTKMVWKTQIDEAFKFWDSSHTNRMDEFSRVYYLPFRELYESYTQLKHYDFMVFAGALSRMSVKIHEKELDVVTARVADWANSFQGKRGIILIYSYFANILFGGENSISFIYNPNDDICLYRKQMITHMLVILWCWCYFHCGPESHALKWTSESGDHINGKEDGHAYLNRVKYELCMLTGKEFTKENVYEDIDIFARAIDKVPGRENTVGLLRLFQSKYAKDSSEIAREHAKLLKNCINRSLGSSTVFCKDMFS